MGYVLPRFSNIDVERRQSLRQVSSFNKTPYYTLSTVEQNRLNTELERGDGCLREKKGNDLLIERDMTEGKKGV